ncbi:hypothetical protein [Rhizobium alvei]|uniref:Uncharacterized protein n=1 Tax=Rhizobium alvei TaxID=1132659 RepID=A0ABT8YQ08_9HYPH|nr:hypothetical protein [Rhizobium alvei]MDO6965806.1 hypothetical protein [Rhizobium alvei]
MRTGNTGERFALRGRAPLAASLKDVSAVPVVRLTLAGFTLVLDGKVVVLERSDD